MRAPTPPTRPSGDVSELINDSILTGSKSRGCCETMVKESSPVDDGQGGRSSWLSNWSVCLLTLKHSLQAHDPSYKTSVQAELDLCILCLQIRTLADENLSELALPLRLWASYLSQKHKTQHYDHVRGSAVCGGLKQWILTGRKWWIKQQEGGSDRRLQRFKNQYWFLNLCVRHPEIWETQTGPATGHPKRITLV